jgi:hypothetical protein
LAATVSASTGEEQADISFGYRVLAVDGSTVIAHWAASFTRVTSQSKVSLDGVIVLEFDDSGACRTLREWWHRKEA